LSLDQLGLPFEAFVPPWVLRESPDGAAAQQPERRVRKLAWRQQRVLDAGGGASLLVDSLLDLGYVRPVVLDVSEIALERTSARQLGTPFELLEESRELHRTPSGGEQKFNWAVFRRT
jgi:hypothetical protein